MEVVKFTQSLFDEITADENKEVLVDFFATWCGPCKMMSPVVDQIAKENESITIGSVDVDAEGELCREVRRYEHPHLHRAARNKRTWPHSGCYAQSKV